ncbi:unnamed protein product [Malus baccata var. baccata]
MVMHEGYFMMKPVAMLEISFAKFPLHRVLPWWSFWQFARGFVGLRKGTWIELSWSIIHRRWFKLLGADSRGLLPWIFWWMIYVLVCKPLWIAKLSFAGLRSLQIRLWRLSSMLIDS